MLKEMVEFLMEKGRDEEVIIRDGNEREYSLHNLNPIKEPMSDTLKLSTLKSLTDYLNKNVDNITDQNTIVHIVNVSDVRLYGEIEGDFKQRQEYIRVMPTLPNITLERSLDPERFIIQLQSMFQETEDQKILLKVCGNLKSEDVKTVGDDGVSQSVTIKTGVSTVGDVLVPNPVTLKPYGTFIEIEQPESQFIFRMHSVESMALYEADGGAWIIKGMEAIKNYLEENIDAELKDVVKIIC